MNIETKAAAKPWGLTFGVIIMLLCSSLAFVWPLCSASLLISYQIESRLYFISLCCIVSAAVAIYYTWGGQLSKGPIIGLLVAAGAGLLFVVTVLLIWGHSNDLRFYWVNRSISAREWSKITEEMEDLGARLLREASATSITLTRKELPDYFSKTVGRKDDFYYGSIAKQPDGSRLTLVAYGSKSRFWGVLQGDDPRARWPSAKVIGFGTNAWYFQAVD